MLLIFRSGSTLFYAVCSLPFLSWDRVSLALIRFHYHFIGFLFWVSTEFCGRVTTVASRAIAE